MAHRHGITDAALLADVLAAYRVLDAYPEVPAMLAALRDMGLARAILSNGEPRMLADAVRSAGIAALLDDVLSVEAVGVFKPDPRVYQLVVDRFALPPDAIGFCSSNPWDAFGALAFGFQVFWVNRTAQPDEYGLRGKVTELADLCDVARRCCRDPSRAASPPRSNCLPRSAPRRHARPMPSPTTTSAADASSAVVIAATSRTASGASCARTGGSPGGWPTNRRLGCWSRRRCCWRVRGWRTSRRLYSGSQFAPAALAPSEQAALRRLQGRTLEHPSMPDAVRLEMPDWLLPHLAARFDATELGALLQPAPLDLRVNLLKATRDAARAALAAEGLEATPTPFSAWGLRIEGRRRSPPGRPSARGWWRSRTRAASWSPT